MRVFPSPETDRLDLALRDRPVLGKDVLEFQQWLGATMTETSFLFGLSVPRWLEVIRHPEAPVADPAVALLVWALAHYPETRFLPLFPEVGEVYPLYAATGELTTCTLGDRRQTRFGKTLFGLMLGRDIGSAARWLSETQPLSPTPPVYRLLFALRNILLTYGVFGFDAWVKRVTVEARARGLIFSARMTSWTRMLEERPATSPRRRRVPFKPQPRAASAPGRAPGVSPPAGRPAVADPEWLGLNARAVTGNDLALLRQWTGTSIADCCYLLGITVPRWHEYSRDAGQPLRDASVALLVWALLHYPESHFLPVFPDPAAVYPLYQNTARSTRRTLPDPASAFALLLGRDRRATARWLAGQTSPHALTPPVRRLLLVLHTLLTLQGVTGFDAWADRARLEAAARGIDLDAPKTGTWARSRTSKTGRPLGRPPKSATAAVPPVRDT